jgi:hypothetical protein
MSSPRRPAMNATGHRGSSGMEARRGSSGMHGRSDSCLDPLAFDICKFIIILNSLLIYKYFIGF